MRWRVRFSKEVRLWGQSDEVVTKEEGTRSERATGRGRRKNRRKTAAAVRRVRKESGCLLDGEAFAPALAWLWSLAVSTPHRACNRVRIKCALSFLLVKWSP